MARDAPVDANRARQRKRRRSVRASPLVQSDDYDDDDVVGSRNLVMQFNKNLGLRRIEGFTLLSPPLDPPISLTLPFSRSLLSPSLSLSLSLSLSRSLSLSLSGVRATTTYDTMKLGLSV